MKNNIIFIVLFSVIVSSCSSPRYLPDWEYIDTNYYGSHISISRFTSDDVDGELISVDSTNLIVLSEYSLKCVVIPIKDIEIYDLTYAKPIHYGWSIPVFLLSTISHGLMLILTAPINLIVTTIVTIYGEYAFCYDNNHLTKSQLKMFARFPNGIPENVKLEDITNSTMKKKEF